MINPFFQNKGPLKIDKILNSIKAENNFENLDSEIFDIKDLVAASSNEISFFHSKKYESVASITKASYCLTTNKLSNILPKNCKPIEVDNVLVSTAMITSMFYPDAITDDFDTQTLDIEKTSFNNSTNHGQNILIGKNVKIGNNVIIKSFSHLESCKIENKVEIGPYARIRPNTILKEGSKIGNFVEVKKSIVGKKSKINHLSYVGDSQIGKSVNIGAGTITCNYDGVKKSKTKIKDNVFVGSNSSLVAPLTIEKESIIGAGSVITKNVKKQSLALTRSSQTEIKNYKRK